MGTSIPWHGKMSVKENHCPHCGSDQYSDVSMNVMELSTQHYKLCTKCQGQFIDTYLIVWDEDGEQDWSVMSRWEKEDMVALFGELMSQGILEYDEHNPNEDSDYYNIPTQSINFIKGDCDE